MKLPVFLSASVPYGPRVEFYRPDPLAIREAVHALIGIILPERDLVFGGHPAISPFVWEAARSLHRTEAVHIYQSELYFGKIPQEAGFFKNLIWTRAIAGNRDLSLEHMRELMIVKRADETGREIVPEYGAAIFLGGMDGVEEEWDIFRATYSDVLAIPVASTQGAALRILDDDRNRRHPKHQAIRLPRRLGSRSQNADELRHNLNYRSLFRRIFHSIP